MANKRIEPHVQEIFEKYLESENQARRLAREDALLMLQKEFLLDRKRSYEMFVHFDADSNDFLSLWEFQHFYNVVGNRAQELIKQFDELDINKKNSLEQAQILEGLCAMKTADGTHLNQKELEFFMKTAPNQNGVCTLGNFVDLVARVRVYKRPPAKKK